MEMHPVTHTERILLMAANEADGASCAKMAQRHSTRYNTFSKIIAHQVKKGRLFASCRPAARVRWFDSKARADDWAAMEPCVPSEWSEAGFKAWDDHPERYRVVKAKKAPKPAKKAAPKQTPKLTTPVKKPGNLHSLSFGKKAGPKALTTYAKAIPAPVHIPHTPQVSGTATVPASVVRSKGLSAGYDPRVQCGPDEKPYGAGFAAAGIGRYLEVRA